MASSSALAWAALYRPIHVRHGEEAWGIIASRELGSSHSTTAHERSAKASGHRRWCLQYREGAGGGSGIARPCMEIPGAPRLTRYEIAFERGIVISWRDPRGGQCAATGFLILLENSDNCICNLWLVRFILHTSTFRKYTDWPRFLQTLCFCVEASC